MIISCNRGFQSLKKENERLRELLGSQERLARGVLIAELLGVIPTPNTHQIILDKVDPCINSNPY